MKKNNNFKKVITSLLFIMILTFSGVAVVLGNSGGSSGSNAGGNGSGVICETCSCKYGNLGVYGVRLSLVDYQTGKRISGTKSIDVFAEFASLEDTEEIYTILNDNTNKYNRMEMVSSFTNSAEAELPSPTLYSTSWSAITKYSASALRWDEYSSLQFNFSNSKQSIDYALFVKTLFNSMSNEIVKYNESGNINDIAVANLLFEKLGGGYLQNYSSEQLENTYLAIEPIISIYVKGTSNTGEITEKMRLFYGTPTQLAYAFRGRECQTTPGGGFWILGNEILEQVFNVVLYAPQDCGSSSERCAPVEWPAVSGAPSGGKNIRLALTDKKKSYGIGYIWLGDLGLVPQTSCDSAVGYLNNLLDKGKIDKFEYREYIKKIVNGTFELTDEETGQIYRVVERQDWDLLRLANYKNHNGGYAACSNIVKVNQDCESAINYINSNYSKGTQDYHDAVAEVRDGTFEYYKYVDGALTKVKVDAAYSNEEDYALLIKSNYINHNGGVAACEPLNNSCLIYEGSSVQIDDCTTGTTYFKDLEDPNAWLACGIAYTKDGNIYSSDNTGHIASSSDNGGVVGNSKYCELFCYEEFETSFPTNVYGVKAGQTFTWGNSNGVFGTVTVNKKCSTQSYVKGQQGYRFEEWKEDYNKNEKALIKSYMNKAAYEKARDKVNNDEFDYKKDSKYTSCEECSTCGTDPDVYGCYCEYTCEKRFMARAEIDQQDKNYTDSYIGTIVANTFNLSYETDYIYETEAEAKKAAKDGLLALIQEYIDSSEDKYEDKVGQEQPLLQQIRQCTNNLAYVYDTDIRFTFSEPVNTVYGSNSRNFSFDGNLVLDATYGANEDNVDTSQCTEKTVYSYECSGEGSDATCTRHAQKVLDCSMVKWNISGMYMYLYPTEEFKWYSLKTDGTLVNEVNKGLEDEAFFYSVGFGLPTAFSLTDGVYGLKVTVDKIGDKATMSGEQQYNVTNGHFAPLANNVNTISGDGYGFDYSCVYEVKNESFGNECEYDDEGNLTEDSPAYCDEDKDDTPEGSLVGIDITYRMVTLLNDGDSIDKAFPGIDGEGREPADNWNSIGSDKIKEILNADIYDTDQAMYEIMLDVNAIQQIRKDNETYFDAGKDPYTSYVDADNAQKVYCVTGDAQQKYCASDFISRLYTGTGLNYRLLGTCLPTSNTLERAEYILEKGCDTSYTYPTINWKR